MATWLHTFSTYTAPVTAALVTVPLILIPFPFSRTSVLSFPIYKTGFSLHLQSVGDLTWNDLDCDGKEAFDTLNYALCEADAS